MPLAEHRREFGEPAHEGRHGLHAVLLERELAQLHVDLGVRARDAAGAEPRLEGLMSTVSRTKNNDNMITSVTVR